MKHRSHLSDAADQLLKDYDQYNSMRSLSSNKKASGLMSFLTGKSEDQIIRNELEYNIPRLKNCLQDLLQFFEKKSEWNGNIPNLRKEISKCDSILTNMEECDLEDLRIKNKWVQDVKIKYGFEFI